MICNTVDAYIQQDIHVKHRHTRAHILLSWKTVKQQREEEKNCIHFKLEIILAEWYTYLFFTFVGSNARVCSSGCFYSVSAICYLSKYKLSCQCLLLVISCMLHTMEINRKYVWIKLDVSINKSVDHHFMPAIVVAFARLHEIGKTHLQTTTR